MEHLSINELLDKETASGREDTRTFESFKDAHNIYGQGAYNVAPRTFETRGETFTQSAPTNDSYAPYGDRMEYRRPSQQSFRQAPQNERPYDAPAFDPYRQGGANANYQTRPMYQDTPYQGMQGYRQDGGYTPYQNQSLFDFTASEQMSRMNEFEGRLAPQNNFGYQRRQVEAEQQAAYEEQLNAAHPAKRRKTMGVKSKIILGLYVALVAVVITLIAVNAGRINSGKAVIPSSKVEYAQEYVVENNFQSPAINSLYDFKK